MDAEQFMEENIAEVENIKAGLLAKFIWLDHDDAKSFANMGYAMACHAFDPSKQYDPGKWIRQIGILRAIDSIRTDLNLSGYSSRRRHPLTMLSNHFNCDDTDGYRYGYQSTEEDPYLTAMHIDEKRVAPQRFEDLLNRIAEKAELSTAERYTVWLKYGHAMLNREIAVVLPDAGLRMRGSKDAPFSECNVSRILMKALRKMRIVLITDAIIRMKYKAVG